MSEEVEVEVGERRVAYRGAKPLRQQRISVKAPESGAKKTVLEADSEQTYGGGIKPGGAAKPGGGGGMPPGMPGGGAKD